MTRKQNAVLSLVAGAYIGVGVALIILALVFSFTAQRTLLTIGAPIFMAGCLLGVAALVVDLLHQFGRFLKP